MKMRVPWFNFRIGKMRPVVWLVGIYIYIYVCMPESFICTTLLLEKLEIVPLFFDNLIFAEATSKMEVRNCTLES